MIEKLRGLKREERVIYRQYAEAVEREVDRYEARQVHADGWCAGCAWDKWGAYPNASCTYESRREYVGSYTETTYHIKPNNYVPYVEEIIKLLVNGSQDIKEALPSYQVLLTRYGEMRAKASSPRGREFFSRNIRDQYEDLLTFVRKIFDREISDLIYSIEHPAVRECSPPPDSSRCNIL